MDAIITVIKKKKKASIARNKACNFINSAVLVNRKIRIQEEKPFYFETRSNTKKISLSILDKMLVLDSIL